MYAKIDVTRISIAKDAMFIVAKSKDVNESTKRVADTLAKLLEQLQSKTDTGIWDIAEIETLCINLFHQCEEVA